ncbi:MAG: hypothetical protein K8T10_02305 [Candidatus Eremiobacteraeota bacterium]|nr:hypothetical protein [Candidatus Eremiobacteraeota bacterium]
MPETIGSITSNAGQFHYKGVKKETPGSLPVPEDRVELKEDLTIIEKSMKGWEFIADRVYKTGVVQGHLKAKKKVASAIKYPFRGIMKKINEWADDDDDIKEIRAESKENLERFSGKMNKIPAKKYTNKVTGKKISKFDDDSFWEKHPILHSFYLGYKGIKKVPKLLLKIPRMLFRIMLPAAYSETSNSKVIGRDFLRGFASKLQENSLINKGYRHYSNFMKMPGVSLAMSIIGPVFGVSRMLSGIAEYQKGVKNNNQYQMLDGKVDIMTGALAAIKPLALLAIVTEGMHIFLNYRIKKKGMDPSRANAIMSSVFAAATAPIGLTAYALLAPGKENR